jgi:hypothetical protein
MDSDFMNLGFESRIALHYRRNNTSAMLSLLEICGCNPGRVFDFRGSPRRDCRSLEKLWRKAVSCIGRGHH